MYVDNEEVLSDEQAVTATAVSTNYRDQGAAGDKAINPRPELVFLVTEAFTAAGAATLTISLQTDDNSSFSSATEVTLTSAIPKATLVAGYRFKVRLPLDLEQYYRLNYTVATGPFTAGKISAIPVFDFEHDVEG